VLKLASKNFGDPFSQNTLGEENLDKTHAEFANNNPINEEITTKIIISQNKLLSTLTLL
jgi:hypothetical protein